MAKENSIPTRIGPLLNGLFIEMQEIEKERGREDTPRIVSGELIAKRIINKGGLER